MNKNNFPKVLIISHNPFSSENNMGKTLASYFSQFPERCLRQIYLHGGIPSSNVCQNYYSFSDKDALISIINRFHAGNFLSNQDFSKNKHQYFTGTAYVLGKKKRPYIYFLRDLVWALSSFFNKKVENWIKEFRPDYIFFASGDYAFSYRIALKISKKYQIPLVLCCFDDYYINCEYKRFFLGKIYYRNFMSVAKKIISHSSKILTVNPMMKYAYDEKFNVNSNIIYTPCTQAENKTKYEERTGISYIGGLSLGRDKVLMRLGTFFKKKYNLYIDVYSFEKREEILKNLNEKNGIHFCGGVHADNVVRIQQQSLLLLHIESFDEEIRNRTRYSLSTKISESLGSGTALLAFGPSDIASIQYLIENNYPLVFSDMDSLEKGIDDIFKEDLYKKIVHISNDISNLNHSNEYVTDILVKSMETIYEDHSD